MLLVTQHEMKKKIGKSTTNQKNKAKQDNAITMQLKSELAEIIRSCGTYQTIQRGRRRPGSIQKPQRANKGKRQKLSFKCRNPCGPGHIQACLAAHNVFKNCIKRVHFENYAETNAFQDKTT